MRIKLLILDVDGVITDGTKIYNSDHTPVGKRYMCKDFTAIKRFAAAGVKVIMISGDGWNRNMAAKRNIDFYCTNITKQNHFLVCYFWLVWYFCIILPNDDFINILEEI